MLQSIDHINMSVTNLETSEAWYKQLFDFERVEEGRANDGAPFAILRSGDNMLCLYEHPEFAGPSTWTGKEAVKRHQINHFGFRIDDRQRFEERLRKLKQEVHYGGVLRRQHSLNWYISDPSGHEIEVTLWDDNRVRFD